jgi:hypothetical protein
MLRILSFGTLLVAACSPALAYDVNAPSVAPVMDPWIVHAAITVLGSFVAIRFALEAFARPVQIANAPTFPKYMTSRQQYRLGSWLFVIFAWGFFLLLIYEHRQVVAAVSVFENELPGSVKNALMAVNDESASYLLIVVTVGSVYLYLLTKEAQWNVLLMMRNTIQSWISIPGLAKDIVERIQSSLHVPTHAITQISAESESVGEQDFHKDRNTPDRQWAETCYMRWWLTPRRESGADATFFNEETYGFKDLVREFKLTALAMRACRSGDEAAPAPAEVSGTVKELHEKFSRLVACYLIYRNDSRQELYSEGRNFGIDMSAPEDLGNPLSYWIVYVIALAAAVYVGVYASAISYDWLVSGMFNPAQNPNLALKWVLYSLTNYGLAIIVILLIRFVGAIRSTTSHLITYCWTFAVAFVTGPLGLTPAVHYFGPERLRLMPIPDLFFEMLKWGMGPALVCVYISYYLDRQICGDLPDIDQSYSTVGWRLLNCFAFAAITVFLLLPSLLGMQSEAGASWDSAKLRFVGTGTIFFIAFGLALAAQFALRKRTPQDASRVVAPVKGLEQAI